MPPVGVLGADVVVEERVEVTGMLELGAELTLVAVEIAVAVLGGCEPATSP